MQSVLAVAGELNFEETTRMSTKVEAVFGVSAVKPYEHDQEAGSSIFLNATTDRQGKYAEFFRWTPYGSIELGILNPVAAAMFRPGALVRVTFEEIESPPEYRDVSGPPDVGISEPVGSVDLSSAKAENG